MRRLHRRRAVAGDVVRPERVEGDEEHRVELFRPLHHSTGGRGGEGHARDTQNRDRDDGIAAPITPRAHHSLESQGGPWTMVVVMQADSWSSFTPPSAQARIDAGPRGASTSSFSAGRPPTMAVMQSACWWSAA